MNSAPGGHSRAIAKAPRASRLQALQTEKAKLARQAHRLPPASAGANGSSVGPTQATNSSALKPDAKTTFASLEHELPAAIGVAVAPFGSAPPTQIGGPGKRPRMEQLQGANHRHADAARSVERRRSRERTSGDNGVGQFCRGGFVLQARADFKRQRCGGIGPYSVGLPDASCDCSAAPRRRFDLGPDGLVPGQFRWLLSRLGVRSPARPARARLMSSVSWKK